MAGRWLQRRGAPIMLAALLMVIAAPMQARAQQGTDDLDALNKQVLTLYRQGKYAEATEIAKRSLALAEKKFGPDHPDIGQSLNNLAALYDSQGRYAEAEPLYKRALTICERAESRATAQSSSAVSGRGTCDRITPSIGPRSLVACSIDSGHGEHRLRSWQLRAMIGRVDPKALRQTFKGDAVA
jgi:tetratricopeptide (TPR) repeat protein